MAVVLSLVARGAGIILPLLSLQPFDIAVLEHPFFPEFETCGKLRAKAELFGADEVPIALVFGVSFLIPAP